MERTKLRRQRFNEIANGEQDINNDLFKEYFKCQSPSNMYKELDETKNRETNQIKVDFIKKILSKSQKIIDDVPKDEMYKIEKNENIISIAEKILEFNRQQHGGRLKILTPN